MVEKGNDLENRLQSSSWLGGDMPSKEDAERFAALGGNEPNAETHPNTFAWFTLVARFSQGVRESWTEASKAAAGGGAPA